MGDNASQKHRRRSDGDEARAAEHAAGVFAVEWVGMGVAEWWERIREALKVQIGLLPLVL